MILFFKAQIANQPGLALETVTDRAGHAVHRWKRGVEQWKAIKPVAPFQMEPPTTERKARRPNYPAEEAAHLADSRRHESEREAVAHGLLRQGDAAELHAHTRGVKASELDQGDLSREEELLYEMNSHDDKRDWRPEAHQDSEARVGEDYYGLGAMKDERKEIKGRLKDYAKERGRAGKEAEKWAALVKKMVESGVDEAVPEDEGVGITDDDSSYTLAEIRNVLASLEEDAKVSEDETADMDSLPEFEAGIKTLEARQRKAKARG